jgi:hypothetical protein
LGKNYTFWARVFRGFPEECNEGFEGAVAIIMLQEFAMNRSRGCKTGLHTPELWQQVLQCECPCHV